MSNQAYQLKIKDYLHKIPTDMRITIARLHTHSYAHLLTIFVRLYISLSTK